MNETDFVRLIDALLGGNSPTLMPPVTVALRLLGLDELPRNHAAVRNAWRTTVRQVHPDMVATIHDAPVLAAAMAPALQASVDELNWARDDLIRRIHEPVTANEATCGEDSSRNGLGGTVRQYRPDPCIRCGDESGRRKVWQGRLAGHCWQCVPIAENERARELRRQARANRICPQCWEMFTPPRADAQFCSPRCRQRAYRARLSVGAS